MRCISCAAAVACVELAASDGASGRGVGSTEVASRRGGATTRLHVCLLVEDREVDPVADLVADRAVCLAAAAVAEAEGAVAGAAEARAEAKGAAALAEA